MTRWWGRPENERTVRTPVHVLRIIHYAFRRATGFITLRLSDATHTDALHANVGRVISERDAQLTVLSVADLSSSRCAFGGTRSSKKQRSLYFCFPFPFPRAHRKETRLFRAIGSLWSTLLVKFYDCSAHLDFTCFAYLVLLHLKSAAAIQRTRLVINCRSIPLELENSADLHSSSYPEIDNTNRDSWSAEAVSLALSRN